MLRKKCICSRENVHSNNNNNKHLAQEIAIHSDKLNVSDSWARENFFFQKMKRKTNTIFYSPFEKQKNAHTMRYTNENEMSRFICTVFLRAAATAAAAPNRRKNPMKGTNFTANSIATNSQS